MAPEAPATMALQAPTTFPPLSGGTSSPAVLRRDRKEECCETTIRGTRFRSKPFGTKWRCGGTNCPVPA